MYTTLDVQNCPLLFDWPIFILQIFSIKFFFMLSSFGMCLNARFSRIILRKKRTVCQRKSLPPLPLSSFFMSPLRKFRMS